MLSKISLVSLDVVQVNFSPAKGRVLLDKILRWKEFPIKSAPEIKELKASLCFFGEEIAFLNTL